MDEQTGFNPCFIGLASATGICKDWTEQTFKFQSLFYWISLCDEIKEISKARKARFNPCFIGLASATDGVFVGEDMEYEFQSLFYWISLCDRTTNSDVEVTISVSILVLLD